MRDSVQNENRSKGSQSHIYQWIHQSICIQTESHLLVPRKELFSDITHDAQNWSVLIEGILVRQGAFRSPDFFIIAHLCFCLRCLTILSPAGPNHLYEYSESIEKKTLSGEYVRCSTFRTLTSACQKIPGANIQKTQTIFNMS